MQRPPAWFAASTDHPAVGGGDAPRGRDGRPAPITTISASRGRGALQPGLPSTGAAARAADADRKLRRVIVMSWFPGA